uniref:Ubiquitin carboxyl-terminal hydrolase n=1 Tax=Cacopsylla melanoneura TaxID=428564 RepID=A0A8D9C0C9_9HEMI
MPTYKVKVKWGKELFSIDVDTDEEPLLFKAQLFELTGVQTDRQKVMLKGVTLRDDEWDKFKVSNGSMILMMGSKEEDSMKEPTVKPKFVEDMNESERAVSLNLPSGLNNLGNTCYMNAVIQCLKTIPELKRALKNHKGAMSLDASSPAQSITMSLRDLYECMDNIKVSPSLSPFIMLQVLHNVFPRFADKADDGHYMQQDANECWTEIVRMLKALSAEKQADGQETDKNKFGSFVEQYLYTVMDVELKCAESDIEPATKSTESFQQLSCYITTDVKYMLPGLKNKLKEEIIKKSATLDRDATYIKTSKVCRLPAYLTIQFVRFYYKEKERINAKILKDIKFPIEFDAYELCTPELQEKLAPMREKIKVAEEKQAFEVKKDEKKKMLQQKEGVDKEVETYPFSFDGDIGSNNSGLYTLQAVLTHKGRTSSSGHYVAWVKHPSNGSWIKCDDDTVYPISEEEVLKLSGGGDWHTAYLLLYGPKKLEKTPEEPMTTSP